MPYGMDITVRNWSKEDLSKIGKDKKLTTVFMNVKTFSAETIRHYPYGLRRVFKAQWDDNEEPVTIYATDPQTLRWFIDEQYTRQPDLLWEEKTRVKVIGGRKTGRSQRGDSKPRLSR